MALLYVAAQITLKDFIRVLGSTGPLACVNVAFPDKLIANIV